MAKETPEQIAYARRIMACKDFLPWGMRFALFVLLIIIYQFTGGVYMSAVAQMAGSSAWMNEDIMMAGYASLIGMIMLFPIQFRVIFRFENRTALIVSTVVLMIGTLICGYCDNIPVVVFTSYICGVFKMVATFFCILNIQLCISPTRDLAYFYPFLYTIVLSCIQLSGIATGLVFGRGTGSRCTLLWWVFWQSRCSLFTLLCVATIDSVHTNRSKEWTIWA